MLLGKWEQKKEQNCHLTSFCVFQAALRALSAVPVLAEELELANSECLSSFESQIRVRVTCEQHLQWILNKVNIKLDMGSLQHLSLR